uniref:Uncharacterized protein n=1 Tax=Ditylenchus dipsaci TaxID=166011 RepID=A0A915E532_9BILA
MHNKMASNSPNQPIVSFDALGDKLSAHIASYNEKNQHAMLDFCDDFIGGENRVEALHRYVKRHTNLDHLMFFCVEWAHKYNIFDNSCFGEQHLCLLIIQFGLKHLGCDSINGNSQWLERTGPDFVYSDLDCIDISNTTGGLGAVFVSFLKFLGSREFKKVSILNFANPDLGVESFFRGREWAPLHQAALNTYHQLVFSGRLDCLPCPYPRAFPSTLTEIIEAPSFILEVPRSRLSTFEDNSHTAQVLCEHTQCLGISFRHHPNCHRLLLPPTTKEEEKGADAKDAEEKKQKEEEDPIIRLIVSSHGNRSALAKLRSLLAVHPNINLTKCRKAGIRMLVMQVVERVDRLLLDFPSSLNIGVEGVA